MFILLLPCEWGGGLANGLGGPVAPADSKAEADGDGGGNTTTELWGSVPLRCVVSAVVRGEVFDSAVLLPASDCSSGIWTLRRGLAPPPDFRLLEREGGLNVRSVWEDATV